MTDAPDPFPTDPEILYARIHDEWEALAAVVATLDEPHIVRRDEGEWSVKDILAHIAAWEKFLIANQFLGLSAGEALCVDEDVVARGDENEVNAIFFERNRDKPLAEVQSDWYETHRWLMSEISKLDEERLKRPTECFGPAPRPLAQWIVFNTYEHYADHRRMIEKRRMG
ncbi:MAG: ClbS/DfsB family four-helix bundle protein [Anaerolineales bacterium]|nr:ClbS/DfsB family four-helix bundle protein [Anaerolineales bacterium]